MTLDELQREAFAVAKQNGFHEEAPDVFRLLGLIHTEVSEAFEEARLPAFEPREIRRATTPRRKPTGFPIELADVVIRCFDLAEALGVDLQAAIKEKMEYNWKRDYRHGGKRA